MATVVLIAVVVATWFRLFPPSPTLDPQRVVVYPLGGNSAALAASHEGENIAAMIVTALDFVGPLRAEEGWDFLDHEYRLDMGRFTVKLGAEIARTRGAGHFITGRIFSLGDSTRVILTLHDVAGDSVKDRRDRVGPEKETWRHGVRAASELIPTLFPEAEPVDFGVITDRDLEAVAYFFVAQSQFRQAQFDEALPYYDTALAKDSLLFVAALRGAEAATWSHQMDLAGELIVPTLERATWTAPRYAEFAKGFLAYVGGQADFAVHHFRNAISLDSTWAEPWRALGDVYTHLLPRDAPLDSLAAAAFDRAHRLSPHFAPVLYHLIEIAARAGDVDRADGYLEELRGVAADSSLVVTAALMLECVRKSRDGVDWAGAVRDHPDRVLDAGYALSPGGYQTECSRAAFEAVWRHDELADRSGRARRFNALVGLQSILAAQGRLAELAALLAAAHQAFPAQVGMLYILDALAGAPVEPQAHEAAEQLREMYRIGSISSRSLWFLGIWNAARGEPEEAWEIAQVLDERASRSGEREERLLAQSMAARAALARADSTTALELFQSLRPTAGSSGIAWLPWESLGGERLALAGLLLAQGDVLGAHEIASNFDAPAPVIYLIYLPQSLSVRVRAAQGVPDGTLAEESANRLGSLRNEGARIQ
jgi:hypothetical protein